MEQILLAYSLPIEAIVAIMMLYRNTKVKVHGDTDYFNIVAGVLQGDTLAPYLFIICLDYMLRTSIDEIKENGFLLHSLERTAAGIGLYINPHKTEYMCFNQTGSISTLNSSSLKLVDKFTYLGNSVLSTETDINTWLAKAWTAIDRLSVIWKSDLTDKMKRSFSKQRLCWYCYMDALHGR